MLENGVKPGDLVAMYLTNSAEFIAILFATLSIGAGPALINYNLEGKALMHCLAVCESKLMIVDDDAGCQQRTQASAADIEASGMHMVTLDTTLKSQISSRNAIVPPDSLRSGMSGNMPFCLIYTSGEKPPTIKKFAPLLLTNKSKAPPASPKAAPSQSAAPGS
jgi:acyl-coenzyme A synthetase/AMP-(fatty) acid ligase